MQKMRLGTIMICIILFIVLTVSLNTPFIIFLDSFNGTLDSSYILENIFAVITILGDYRFLGLLIVCVWLFHKKSRTVYTKLFILISITSLILFLIKTIISRARPDLSIDITLIGYSFPSGHTALAIVFYGYLMYLNNNYNNNILITILFGILIFIIILSRVFLSYHFVSDILGGILLGISVLNMYILLTEKRS